MYRYRYTNWQESGPPGRSTKYKVFNYVRGVLCSVGDRRPLAVTRYCARNPSSLPEITKMKTLLVATAISAALAFFAGAVSAQSASPGQVQSDKAGMARDVQANDAAK